MLRLYNTLSHKIEEFRPLNDPQVGIYSCGPTVYDYAHIGHMRRYVGDDILVRILEYKGYTVKHVMNVTDVGHLVSDADSGEDKMEKGAKKFGMSVWDVAKKFEKQFFDSTDSLNIKRPDVLMHATDYIKEQIELIKILEKKGYTYKIADGIYFDTSKFPDYFKFSRQNPKELKKGARVEFVEGKKNIADFALWKFSPSFKDAELQSGKVEKRQMEWDSPWGVGLPGWHVECSAMSIKALGDTIDIHTGGIDHINIHHSNEIAQSECATGKKFVNYWVHHNFLVVDKEKMSKSLGNFYTVQDIIEKGFDPIVLRYLYLQTHYRQEMNFTWEALEAAKTAYKKLVNDIKMYSSESKEEKDNRGSLEFEKLFMDALNDDMNTPKALAIMWEMVRSATPLPTKLTTLKNFDKILGLGLFERAKEERIEIPQNVLELVDAREEFRKKGDFKASDELRSKIQELGFEVMDTKTGPQVDPLHKDK